MAILANIEISGGIPVTGAYIRIHDIMSKKKYSDGTHYATYGLSVYKDRAEANLRDGNAQPNGRTLVCSHLDRFKFTVDLASANNALVQAYTNLKTQSGMTNIVDVI